VPRLAFAEPLRQVCAQAGGQVSGGGHYAAAVSILGMQLRQALQLAHAELARRNGSICRHRCRCKGSCEILTVACGSRRRRSLRGALLRGPWDQRRAAAGLRQLLGPHLRVFLIQAIPAGRQTG
jgi:hypothetical protein